MVPCISIQKRQLLRQFAARGRPGAAIPEKTTRWQIAVAGQFGIAVGTTRCKRLAQYGYGIQQQPRVWMRSEEHTSELQSLMRISYAVFCLQKTKTYLIFRIILHKN